MTPTLEVETRWIAESADAGKCSFCGEKTKGTQWRLWILIGMARLRQKYCICRKCRTVAIENEKIA